MSVSFFFRTVANALIVAAVPFSLVQVNAAETTTKPNILYVFADQWRGSATGYAGDPNVKTPNLDQLAKESVNFCNAVSVCPVCTPHRAALMTGRFPTSTGMFQNDLYLPSEELCMAEIFAAAGYATGYIGKWHLDGHGRDAYIPPERRQGWEYWKADECTHTYNKSVYYSGNDPKQKIWDGYDAYAQTEDAQQYLEGRAHNSQPFVFAISFGAPHFPHGTAPDEFKKLYVPSQLVISPNVPADLEEDARRESQGYYAHCSALDRCIGKLMTTLKETGLDKNTIVVFSSDHGESMGSHGNPPCVKQVPWDESARIPFLIRLPGAKSSPGVTVKTPITTPDVLPTLLGLAGVVIPASIEGDDLSQVVLHPETAPDRAALYMAVAPFSTIPQDSKREYRAIRTSRYTYVRDLKGTWLLYDDEKDPYQMKNLANNPENSELRKNLDERLNSELKKRGDDFIDGDAMTVRWGLDVKKNRKKGDVSEDNSKSPKRQSP